MKCKLIDTCMTGIRICAFKIFSFVYCPGAHTITHGDYVS